MIQLIIEIPDEEEDLLLLLLPKLGARVISRIDKNQSLMEVTSIIEPFVQFDGQYFYDIFEIKAEKVAELHRLYPTAIYKNNRDVGKISTAIVVDYLSSKFPTANVVTGTKGADLEFTLAGKTELIEVKGTTAGSISWPTIKVSSTDCHNGLKNGMTLIRVIDAHTNYPKLFFLRYGRDFVLRPEPRWSVHPIRP